MDPVMLSPSALLTWHLANREAILSQSDWIEPQHVYLAILMMLDGIFSLNPLEKDEYTQAIAEVKNLRTEAINYLGLNDDELTRYRRKFSQRLPVKAAPEKELSLNRSPSTRALFLDAIEEQAELNSSCVTFLNLLKQIDLEEMKFFMENLTLQKRQNTISSDNLKLEINETPEVSMGAKTPVLDSIGRDLTALAKLGKLPPVVGRNSQMTAIARILHRTSKRNVILIGEAGVGKTAVVEGLAQKITSDAAIPELRRLRIIQVNIGDLVSGTSFRGQMEERVQGLIQEVCSDPNLVLFIDEIHLVVGSGTTNQSNMDIANLLKPALARDDFRCIGATTNDEYERFIKTDSAFKRRFQVLQIPEPSRLETIAICQRWAARFQSNDQMIIELPAIEAAVDLSINYLPDRRLPDKAIDLLENAKAYLDISTLEPDGEMQSAKPHQICVETIQNVLHDQYGIILQSLEHQKPEEIASGLMAELVGQDEAIILIKRSLSMLSMRKKQDGARPMGVLLFTGPTGTGKTHAARCLARFLYPNQPDAFIRFAMNEYKERYDLSRLIGAAPGLIGHDQAGVLFQFIESHPQGVILLDEIEKSHPEIQDFFLQIFDNGEGRDSRGRFVNFRQHLFILTANIFEQNTPGISKTQTSIESLLHKVFRPEFVGRIDQVIPFNLLTADDYHILFKRQIAYLIANLIKNDLQISVDEVNRLNIILYLSENSDGARGFLHRFEQFIALPILEIIGRNKDIGEISIRFVNGQICVEANE